MVLSVFGVCNRRYCTARLRRLYKSLKFTHGRGKYTKRAIQPSMVTEVRLRLASLLVYYEFFGLCLLLMNVLLMLLIAYSDTSVFIS